MARQRIFLKTAGNRENIPPVLDKFLTKNNYINAYINDEYIIYKKNTIPFLNRHYLKIYIGDEYTILEGWFCVSHKEYCIDDGIMYSEKHRGLTQSIEAIVSLLNNMISDIKNGTDKIADIPEDCVEYRFTPWKK